eukprot:gene37303-37943_t
MLGPTRPHAAGLRAAGEWIVARLSGDATRRSSVLAGWRAWAAARPPRPPRDSHLRIVARLAFDGGSALIPRHETWRRDLAVTAEDRARAALYELRWLRDLAPPPAHLTRDVLRVRRWAREQAEAAARGNKRQRASQEKWGRPWRRLWQRRRERRQQRAAARRDLSDELFASHAHVTSELAE